MADKHYNFFDSVTKSFDKAAKFTQWENGILEQIKACNAVYRMKFPIKRDDGSVKVISKHTAPSIHITKPLVKAGIRYSEMVDQDERGNGARKFNDV